MTRRALSFSAITMINMSLLIIPSLTAAEPQRAASVNNEIAGIGGKISSETNFELRGPADTVQTFAPRFLVFFSEKNPTPALRYANIPNVPNYNVLTWGRDEEIQIDPNLHIEDGFDPKVDRRFGAGRTANVFSASPYIELVATSSEKTADGIRWRFPAHAWGQLEATIQTSTDQPGVADLRWKWTPAKKGYYSIGYVGAPATPLKEAREIWQPMIWNDLRFPNDSYLTPAFLCPLPGGMVTSENGTVTVMAASEEFPFLPMPTQQKNNPFGIAIRDRGGDARPMIFAPVLGGDNSFRSPDQSFTFHCTLHVSPLPITEVYEQVARNQFGFRDLRENRISSMNATLDRMIDYGLSHWSEFNSDLRGSEYSTDVPGAVKNVSPIAPLGAALVGDRPEIYQTRALPTLEYICSREKFLFAVSPDIKIQSPSWRLKGPASPVRDLVSAYEMSDGQIDALLQLSSEQIGKEKVFNLDTPTKESRWQNYLALYRVNQDPALLDLAEKEARKEIAARAQRLPHSHDEGSFFWPSFTSPWIDYLELYEETKNPDFLAAARDGARHYVMFCWMCPQVPDELIMVDTRGKAPRYRGGDHLKDIPVQPTQVEAWQVSEIGLTPESAGTCKGHRAILNAHYAPFMARIGWYAKDPFLVEVARWAVIGRYRNFPGYHMNTARTTVFMEEDFPLRPASELNAVTSIHYNHIWSHIGLMVDSLVSESIIRSDGKIHFPARFTEGYAYLQSNAYGDRPGTFYGENDVWLWMPEQLLQMETHELNYVSARKGNSLYLMLMNESAQPVEDAITINPEHLRWEDEKVSSTGGNSAQNGASLKVLCNTDSRAALKKKALQVTIPPRGTLALRIDGVTPQLRLQHKIQNSSNVYWTGPAQLDVAGTTGMMMSFGPELTSAYVYLEAIPAEVSEATLSYSYADQKGSLTDQNYPYEFTVPVSGDANEFRFSVIIKKPNGKVVRSSEGKLERRSGASPSIERTRLEHLPISSGQ